MFILVGASAAAAGVTAQHPDAEVERVPAGADPPTFVAVTIDE